MSSPKLALYLAAEKYRLGKLNHKALPLYEQILEIEPNDLGVLKKIVQIQLSENMKEAAAETWLIIARTHSAGAQHVMARDAAQKSLDLNPGNPAGEEFLTKLAESEALVVEEDAKKTIEMAPPPPIRLDTQLFKDLNEEQLESIIKVIIPLRITKGTIVFKEGDSSNSLYIVKEGMFEVRTSVSGGEREDTVFSRLTPGQFFGEFAFLTGKPRVATVMASADSEVYQLTKEALEGIIKKFPEVEDRLFLFYKSRALDLVLAKSPLFHSLAVEERRELLELFVLRKFKAAETIIREGQQDDNLFLIKKGEARVETSDPSGHVIFLGTLHQHQFFGEISFLTGLPRTATVLATTDCEVLLIGKEDLQQVIEKFPTIEPVLRRYQQSRADSTLKKLMSGG